MPTPEEVAAAMGQKTAKPLKAKSVKEKKPKTSTKKPRVSEHIPYAKVKQLYEAGKDYTEIAKTTGLYHKDAVYPEHSVANALTRLSKGVTVDGKLLKIKRGKAGRSAA